MTSSTEDQWALATQQFAAFCQTIAKLRHPKDGCPWDLKQTHFTLRKYMLEEAYEAAEAMSDEDPDALKEELGDVLLQVVLNAQVAKDRGAFDIGEVIGAIDAKMIRRHPHVFQPDDTHSAMGRMPLEETWEKIKAKEKAAKKSHDDNQTSSFFHGVTKTLPSQRQAQKIGEIAAKIDFDWDNSGDVLDQVQSEIDELRAELKASSDSSKVAAELGDVYFSLAQLCRHLKLDAEVVALDGNRKFLRRFADLEKLAEKKGVKVAEAGRAVLEALWREVKRENNGN